MSGHETRSRAGRAVLSVAHAGAAVAAALSGGAAWAVNDMPGGPGVNQLNLTRGVTRIAADQWWIHNFLLIVCLAIFVAVFGVMFYSLWAHRKSRGAKPADFHESTAVEIAWTIVPFLIIVGLAIPATRMVVEQKDTSQADLTIKATGYQWKWGYEYLKGEGAGISFLSDLATPLEQIEGRAPKSETYLMEVDNPLVVPVGQKIRMVITANDVIHAWMVPAFGVKQDAIPGFVRDTWFRAEKEGTFRGACAELCGKNHAFMPIVVEVKSQEAYKAWADGKKKEMLAKADDPTKDWTVAELNERGAKVYASNCVACHQGSGKGVPGAFPALEGSKLVLGRQEDQIAILLNGKPGTSMAAFKQLSDVELAAVATYTRNAWGNKAEDTVVQPKDFTAARK
ncbi:MAG: cytochrome c oxidase subunit II [Burkholderiales bacterium]|nr:cytochrome c oxidase subunit II [Burkholderiales bacterium]